MKHLYTFLLLSLISATTVAQDFVYPLGQHRVDTVQAENYESYTIDVVTPTPENITFKWEMVSNTFDPNWSCSVCDYSGCYVGFPPYATMTAITASEMSAGTTGFIKCNITVGYNYGDGKVEIYVYDQNDYSRGDTVSFFIHWPAPATSVEESSLDVSLYPNPVVDQLTVSNKSNGQGTITISDLLGKQVYKARMIGNSREIIEMSGLRSGVYLVKLESDNGNSSTQKIVKR